MKKPAGVRRAVRFESVEATTGFEPVNRGFADLRVEPLHHVAAIVRGGPPRDVWLPLEDFEPRFTDPKSAVLPLDEGAAGTCRGRNGAEDGTRTRDPHLGKVMLYQLSHFRPEPDHRERWCREPDSNWRHRDFQSRALPTELSRPDGQPAWGCPSAVGRIPRAAGPRSQDGQGIPTPIRGRRGSRSIGRGERPLPRQLAEPVDPIDDRRVGRHQARRPLLELLDRVREVQVLRRRGWRPRGPPGRPRSWPAPAPGRTGCGSARTDGRVGEVLALAADGELDEPADDRREDREDDAR